MSLITNPIFNEVEIAYLDFVLRHEFSEKSEVIEQLNNMKETTLCLNWKYSMPIVLQWILMLLWMDRYLFI